jgi:hypothetical protein
MIRNLKHKVLLHACPRCRGDLFPELDEEGFYACLQCGRRIAAEQLAGTGARVLAPAA